MDNILEEIEEEPATGRALINNDNFENKGKKKLINKQPTSKFSNTFRNLVEGSSPRSKQMTSDIDQQKNFNTRFPSIMVDG